jgi:hypothetical protein
MKISMHTMASDSFVGGLESLSKLLAKGAAFAEASDVDLINARLAPDMFPLAQQVQFVCFNAKDGVSRLTGRGPAPSGQPGTSFEEFQADIADALAFVRAIPAGDYEGAEERDCSITPANAGVVIRMDGLVFLRGWALPHFYFHLVTAYDIMRHKGVALGKPDFVSWIAPHVELLKT